MQHFHLIYHLYSNCAIDPVLSFIPSVPSRTGCSWGSAVAFGCPGSADPFPVKHFLSLLLWPWHFSSIQCPSSLFKQNILYVVLDVSSWLDSGYALWAGTRQRGCRVLLRAAHPEAYGVHLSLISDVHCKCSEYCPISPLHHYFFFNE